VTTTTDPARTSGLPPPRRSLDRAHALAGLVTAVLGVVLLVNAAASVQVVIALSGAGSVVARGVGTGVTVSGRIADSRDVFAERA